MAKKSLGHMQLQWTCPSCQTTNPGTEKVCQNCGMPQPEEVGFEIGSGEKIIAQSRAEEKKQPDIHCPYCGSRNPADAKICSQCGGNIEEGLKRKSGQVLGAYSDKEPEKITCPNCGFQNNARAGVCEKCGGSLKTPKPPQKEKIAAPKAVSDKSSQKKQKISPILILFIILVIFGFLAVCIIIIGALSKTEDLNGRVTNLYWERSVIVEDFLPLTKEDWADNIPSDATIINCSMEYRYTSQEPEPVSTEICGTPYVVDEGTGYGEVVQDCEYRVYDESCLYEIYEWQAAGTYSLDGYDNQAVWPDPILNQNQRLGAQNEEYQVLFSTKDGDYTYTTYNYSEFLEYPLNSEWNLSINGFNTIKEISPAN